MKPYIKNNIKFRIVSSNAIAKFKSGQAFDFNEITTSNSSFSFATREILLLEYEYFFKWLLRVEKLFLMLEENEKPLILNNTLLSSIEYLLIDIEEVMSSYPELFDNKIIEYIKNFHNTYLQILNLNIKNSLIDNIYFAYPKIVNIISLYLQEIMLILHDYDNNVFSKREQEFLSITDMCINNSLEINSEYYLIDRAKFFNKEFNINKFILKNYSSNNNIENIISKLSKLKLTISDIKNIKTKINVGE